MGECVSYGDLWRRAIPGKPPRRWHTQRCRLAESSGALCTQACANSIPLYEWRRDHRCCTWRRHDAKPHGEPGRQWKQTSCHILCKETAHKLFHWEPCLSSHVLTNPVGENKEINQINWGYIKKLTKPDLVWCKIVMQAADSEQCAYERKKSKFAYQNSTFM